MGGGVARGDAGAAGGAHGLEPRDPLLLDLVGLERALRPRRAGLVAAAAGGLEELGRGGQVGRRRHVVTQEGGVGGRVHTRPGAVVLELRRRAGWQVGVGDDRDGRPGGDEHERRAGREHDRSLVPGGDLVGLRGGGAGESSDDGGEQDDGRRELTHLA